MQNAVARGLKGRGGEAGRAAEGGGGRGRSRVGKRIEENRELQFHRIPEDEGTAGLEAFHGKPNIRGMHRRYTPEFPA